MSNETNVTEKSNGKQIWRTALVTLLMVGVLAVGAYLRFSGLSWDEDQHLHPDERFLTMVSSAISSVQTEGVGYFDTANSSLNPNNRGYTFYVYGTLPLFVTRYLGEWLEMTGYSEINLVGRALSAGVDFLVILLVFLTAARLYNRRVGVLAAAFYALAVLPIQQSHFYTVDTFASFFMMLAVYAAAVISGQSAERKQPLAVSRESLVVAESEDIYPSALPSPAPGFSLTARRFFAHHLLLPSLIFGLALGMAVASKINAAPIALILPLAAGLYLLKLSPDEQRKQALPVFVYLVLGAAVSFLAFRIFQPYAFTGPGFFGIKPSQAWIDTLSTLKAQTSGDVDFPPALQWARRPLSFSWQNLTIWGLGLPLGILAWAGFVFMAWRMFKGDWRKHILLWGWTAAYFGWQSLQWNSTMRYQLPIYPLLAIMAAWFVFAIFDRRPQTADRGQPSAIRGRGWQWLAVILGGVVLAATAAWASAFMGNYLKEHTRIEASRWLLQEMPGPITLPIEQSDGIFYQPLPFYEGTLIQQGQPYDLGFEAHQTGQLSQIDLPHVVDQNAITSSATLFVEISYALSDDNPLASGQFTLESGDSAPATRTVLLDDALTLSVGESYQITLDVSGGDSEIQVCTPVILQVISGQGNEARETYLPQDCLGRYDLPVTLRYTPSAGGDLIGVS
ncbi:MAG TPA: hypothetical protein DEH22_16665, partial [Chloroflexi bacterium]|nr:hypothetical protein [Chloroflexota bacterium]